MEPAMHWEKERVGIHGNLPLVTCISIAAPGGTTGVTQGDT
jgi:hypothetical protein